MNITLENLSQEKSTALWLYSEYMAVLGLPKMNNTSLIKSVYNTILSGQNGDLIRHISFQEIKITCSPASVIFP